MNYQDVYSVFVTKDLKATKDFYVKWFNFQIYFESSFFILLAAVSGDKSFSIGFIDEVHPSSPPDISAMDGKSAVFLTLQVEDAQMEYEKLQKEGLNIYYHLKDEDWGQRRFGIVDPNGMYVDIVQQTTPKQGFWDQYMQVS
jgi:catechol 2,3-dioxygenase-like lactoylglutathione lyase family enzyme